MIVDKVELELGKDEKQHFKLNSDIPEVSKALRKIRDEAINGDLGLIEEAKKIIGVLYHLYTEKRWELWDEISAVKEKAKEDLNERLRSLKTSNDHLLSEVSRMEALLDSLEEKQGSLLQALQIEQGFLHVEKLKENKFKCKSISGIDDQQNPEHEDQIIIIPERVDLVDPERIEKDNNGVSNEIFNGGFKLRSDIATNLRKIFSGEKKKKRPRIGEIDLEAWEILKKHFTYKEMERILGRSRGTIKKMLSERKGH